MYPKAGIFQGGKCIPRQLFNLLDLDWRWLGLVRLKERGVLTPRHIRCPLRLVWTMEVKYITKVRFLILIRCSLEKVKFG